MRLTCFGEKVRHLRMRYDTSLKTMAGAMGISASYLSGIEYGERRLTDQHIDAALDFFRPQATVEELERLLEAGQASKDVVVLDELSPDARGLVAAFARRLQSGDTPPPEVRRWIRNED